MAEAVLRVMVDEAHLGDRVLVESFGTIGYHIGQPADRRAVAALRRRGWPPGNHRARQITTADLAATDLVLCADHANRRDLERLAGDNPDRAKVRLLRSFDPAASADDDEVPDPYGGGALAFDQALTLVEMACRGVVTFLVGTLR